MDEEEKQNKIKEAKARIILLLKEKPEGITLA